MDNDFAFGSDDFLERRTVHLLWLLDQIVEELRSRYGHELRLIASDKFTHASADPAKHNYVTHLPVRSAPYDHPGGRS